MSTLLDIAVSPPAVVFGGVFLSMAIYWLLSLSGFFDLEMLEGAGEGALGGMADGGLADGSMADAPSFLDRSGLDGVPRSITLTLVSFFGWIFSVVGGVALEAAGWRIDTAWEQVLAGLGWLVVAVVASAVAVQPIRRSMQASLGPTRADLIGRPCTVRTARVDESFGQAELDDGDQLVQVRDPQGLGLGLGQRALIYAYEPEAEVFLVTALDLAADPRAEPAP